MFAIKDLDSIKTHAVVLIIPFLAAAYVSDSQTQTFTDPMQEWLRIHATAGLISVLGWASWLFVVVAVVSTALFLLHAVLVWLDLRFKEGFLLAWTGMTLIAAGVFLLTFVVPSVPKSPLNPFWHLAFLCYGFTLLEINSKVR